MSQKVYLIILRAGALLGFVSFFLVYSKFLFPYISSKQIYFNVLIEILIVFWVAFIIKYPKWRPKKSLISIGLVAYFLAILASISVSPDFNLSFWGDVERMLGFFHIVHFLFFYFIIITVFRDWFDWQLMLNTLVVASTVVGISGINESNKYGTLGNKAYMAALMIFGIYFAAYLAWRNRNWRYFRFLYVVPIIIMWIAFDRANIDGAIVGFYGGIGFFLILLGFLHKNMKVKIASVALVVLALSGIFFAFTHMDNEYVENIGPIQAFEGTTFKTRLISWQSAWEGFPDHWLLGSGYGMFGMTFDEFFPPRFYDLTRKGTYFDRAHNNLIDIASTTGVVGLFTYLFVLAAATFYLFKVYMRGRIGKVEFAMLLSLLAAYFVQNLAVFDALVTYIALMVLLGYIHYLQNTGKGTGIKNDLYEPHKKLVDREIFAFLGVGALMAFAIFNYNVGSAKMLTGTITAQQYFGGGAPYHAMLASQQTKGTVLDRDGREAFIRGLLSNTGGLNNLSEEQKREVISYAIDLARKNVEYNPGENLAQMRYAQILNFASKMLRSVDRDLSDKYNEQALTAINKAIEASPGRIPTYNVKAYIQLTQGDKEGAIETLEYASEMNPQYEPTICQLAEIQMIYDEEGGYENIKKCAELNGLGRIRQESVIGKAINHYLEKRDYDTAAVFYRRLSQLRKDDPEVWIKMAKLYEQAGEHEKAKEAALKAAEINPGLKDQVDDYINALDETAVNTGPTTSPDALGE